MRTLGRRSRGSAHPLDPRVYWRVVPVGTRALLALITGATVMAVTLPASVLDWVMLSPSTLSGLRLSALCLSGLVAAPTHFISLIVLLALVGFSLGPRLRQLWQRQASSVMLFVGGVVAVGILADLLLGRGQGIGLMVALGLVGTFALSAERVWGPKRLLIFSTIIIIGSDLVGAVLTAAWPGGFIGLISGRGASLINTDALFHGLIAVYGLIHLRRRLYPLPFTGRAVIWAIVALDVFDLLFVGATRGLMSLSGVLLAVLLVTGEWRPERLRARARLFIRRRRGSPELELIKGRKDQPTLH